MSGVSQAKDSRKNNFNIIRTAAAMLVFCGHLSLILGQTVPNLCGIGIHDLGVRILFLIGGYLIAESWLHDPDPVHYAIRRFFRFYVPFAIMVLVMVFVTGPLISDLGAEGYFTTQYPVSYQYYLRNLRLYIVYAQPGVFTGVPRAYQTNGSIWSMPAEAIFYVLTPVMLSLAGVRRKGEKAFYPLAVFTAVICAADLYLKENYLGTVVPFYGVDLISTIHLFTYYLLGTLFSFQKLRKHLNLELAFAAAVLLLLADQSLATLKEAMLLFLLPCFIFSLALAPKPIFWKYGRTFDPAYGIYLYGFFFAQLMVQHFGTGIGYTKLFLLSFPPTLLAAALSYYLVEKPSVRLGHTMIRSITSRKKSIG